MSEASSWRVRVQRLWLLLPHPVRWVTVLSVGVALVAAGLVFLVLPGPGLPLIVLGLVVLASEFTWAALVLEHVKKQSGSLLGKLRGMFARNRNSDG